MNSIGRCVCMAPAKFGVQISPKLTAFDCCPNLLMPDRGFLLLPLDASGSSISLKVSTINWPNSGHQFATDFEPSRFWRAELRTQRERKAFEVTCKDLNFKKLHKKNSLAKKQKEKPWTIPGDLDFKLERLAIFGTPKISGLKVAKLNFSTLKF